MLNKTRLLACGLSLVCSSPVLAQNKPVGQTVRVISTMEIEQTTKDGKPMKVSNVEVTFEPGGHGIPHRHPGQIYGYVLEGQFKFKIEGKPEQILNAGETFYEPTMVLHETGGNPSDESIARVLAAIVHPADAGQLVIPEPQ